MYFEVIKVSFILKVPVSKADEDGCQGVHHNGILKEDIGAGDQGFMFGYATGTSSKIYAAIFILHSPMGICQV